MGNQYSGGVETEAPEWEPEELPLYDQLEYPPQAPTQRRHEDASDETKSRVIIIDLA
jgi:hypothetical protein